MDHFTGGSVVCLCQNGAQTIRPKTVQPIWKSDNSPKSIKAIQPVLQNARFQKKTKLDLFLGLRSPGGALRARRRFAAITGSKFRIDSYPLLASSQHAGATAAVTIIDWIFSGWIFWIVLAELSELQIGWIVFDRFVWTRPECLNSGWVILVRWLHHAVKCNSDLRLWFDSIKKSINCMILLFDCCLILFKIKYSRNKYGRLKK